MIRRLLLLLTLSIAAAPAEASCGCGAGDRPCAQESLATVPAPLADSEFTFSLCNHCGSDTPSVLGALLYGIVLLPFVLGFKRLLLGRDELVLLRLSGAPPRTAACKTTSRLSLVTAPAPSAATCAAAPARP